MFYHMNLLLKELYQFNDKSYEIAIYRASEDGHLRGYISEGGFGDLVGQISGETAADMKIAQSQDPVQALLQVLKDEIESGSFEPKTEI